MPANLPPQYFEAERRYRLAKTDQEKIACLREMLSIMPKHKGTEKLQAELKTKISKLKKLVVQKKRTRAKRAKLYHIEREGAAQVVLLGLPNVGKSQLLASLTRATPEVAPYPFTTTKPAVGMMPYEDITIQMVDTPPLTDGKAEWWLIDIIRNADLLLLTLDLGEDPLAQLDKLMKNLGDSKVRLVSETTEEAPEGVASKKAILVGSKKDLDGATGRFQLLRDRYTEKLPLVSLSAAKDDGLEDLKREIYEVLNILRVYTKVPGKPPDLTEPVVLERGSTVTDAARAIHKDFAYNLTYARLWGSDKYKGQRVERNHVLRDGDVVEFHV